MSQQTLAFGKAARTPHFPGVKTRKVHSSHKKNSQFPGLEASRCSWHRLWGAARARQSQPSPRPTGPWSCPPRRGFRDVELDSCLQFAPLLWLNLFLAKNSLYVMLNHWKITQVRPFCGCCKADSLADISCTTIKKQA